MKRGIKALAMWEDGHAYSCEVLGSAGRRQLAVQFEDGMQHDAPLESMRSFLDEPLFAHMAALEALHGRPRAYESGRSERAVARSVWCADSAQCGPLQRTIRSLIGVWRGAQPEGVTWKVENGPVEGLYWCKDFLSEDEVRATRAPWPEGHGTITAFATWRAGPRTRWLSCRRCAR